MSDSEFMATWQKLEGRLRGRVQRLVRQHDEVDDLLQDLFAGVFAKREALSASFLPAYLMRAASNKAVDYLRRHSSRSETQLYENLASASPSPEEEFRARERLAFYQAHVAPLIQELSSAHRAALDAFCHSGNYRAAARQLGIPPTTLRSRRDVALRILRTELGLLGPYDSSAPL